METLHMVRVGSVDNPERAHDTCFVKAEHPDQALKRSFPSLRWNYRIRRFHDGVFVYSGSEQWAEIAEVVT